MLRSALVVLLVLIGPLAPARFARAADDARPADAIVRDFEAEQKLARHPLPEAEFQRVHDRIAALVSELRATAPDDARLPEMLPERWLALHYAGHRDEAEAEIQATLTTSRDPALRRTALFYQFSLRRLDPSRAADPLAEAEEFAREAPGDNRGAGLFYSVLRDSERLRPIRLGLDAALGVVALLILAASSRKPRNLGPAEVGRRRRVAARVALAGAGVLVAGLVGGHLYLGDGEGEAIAGAVRSAREWLDATRASPSGRTAVAVGLAAAAEVGGLACSPRALGVLGLAVAAGALAVVARSRRADAPLPRRAGLRAWAVGFAATLAAAACVDAGWTAWRDHQLRARIAREYPDSSYGRIVLGQERQCDRLGQPFELDFVDAITGKLVSMRDFRGKVVVVDFWATWCGPCVGEIPELLRLYRKYHDRGVEFIGVSLDLPEADGGLQRLREFVGERQIPWPQYHEARDGVQAKTGVATGDFSEFWGINGIPTVFLIDRDGRLASAEARGRLDALIPPLLAPP